ncbi:TPA: type II toxin-antitoxin system HigB family toxin [Klebsiella aerogenes]|nr:type II toxin-antitoxin system HigB family toxin [Klebsiella oxytoca]HCD5425971.1 type II toxin-antitoxin system HigB family toxin [Klebsiella aerogenes]HCR0084149.1 type II toxin-antitoxin system HigB family toxin [Klebsiella aerogenes]HCR0222282.1 type II toxin-antitoxin system HigB family toxin [Klebsiella aerogenes]HCR0512037.1 type II toxin-antitoxin system HigB family toxin [Klebsiella aerogenes]
MLDLSLTKPDEIVSLLCDRLRKERINQQMTQSGLAKRAGIGVNTLSNLESGKNTGFENIVRVASKEPFEEATRRFPNHAVALKALYRLVREKDFASPVELRSVFSSLDNFKYRNKWWVLDVGGNNLRVIAYINFVNKRFYVKHITTHAEYDKLTRYYRENKE